MTLEPTFARNYKRGGNLARGDPETGDHVAERQPRPAGCRPTMTWRAEQNDDMAPPKALAEDRRKQQRRQSSGVRDLPASRRRRQNW